MKNMFYGFLLNMWVFGGLSESALHTYVPTFISEEEYQQILLAPKEA